MYKLDPNSLPPEWFDLALADRLNLPSDRDQKIDVNIGFGLPEHNNKYTSFNKFKLESDFFQFKPITKPDIDKQVLRLKAKLEKSINTIKIKHIDSKIHEPKIKAITTKINKKINNIDTVQICEAYPIYPEKNQANKLDIWFNECIKVYNKCVDKHKIDPKLFFDSYMIVKQEIFKDLYGIDCTNIFEDFESSTDIKLIIPDKLQKNGNEKKAPYDVLTDEVRLFCSNLKSAKTNLQNCNINHYEMKYKNVFKKAVYFYT